jgi:hypothetical protein
MGEDNARTPCDSKLRAQLDGPLHGRGLSVPACPRLAARPSECDLGELNGRWFVPDGFQFPLNSSLADGAVYTCKPCVHEVMDLQRAHERAEWALRQLMDECRAHHVLLIPN